MPEELWTEVHNIVQEAVSKTIPKKKKCKKAKWLSAGVQLQQPEIQPEEMDGVSQWDSLSVFYGLPVYFKFKILFYTFTKTLGQRFDIFSYPLPDLLSP